MKQKVAVTGGAGFIGSHLVKNLIKHGYQVIVYDDFSNASGRKNLPKNVSTIRKSILDVDSLRDCFKHVKTVFNLAVKPLPMSFNNPDVIVKVNDYGSYLVSKVCTELHCKLIHVSSSEAYGSAKFLPMKESHPFFPSTIYASSKAASELYVRGFEKTDGLKAVIVRPFNTYGSFMREDNFAAALPRFYNRLNSGKAPIIFGDGNQTRDFTYVTDITEGIRLANETSNAIGGTFNIGQGKEITIKKLAKIMIKNYSKFTNKPFKQKLIYKKARKGDVRKHKASIYRAKKILGYKPVISFDEGIERYIKWRLENKDIRIKSYEKYPE